MATKELTTARLRELLKYDPEAGTLRWTEYRGRMAPAWSIAGTRSTAGYISIKILGRLYQAHVLCWWNHYGKPPDLSIDHINGKRDDNRISNLRLATRSQQKANAVVHKNRSLPKGVSQHLSKFQAEISLHGTRFYLGLFATPELAHAAYCEAAKKHFGDFWYDGSSNRSIDVKII